MLEINKKNALYLAHMGSRGAFGQAVYDWLQSGEGFYAVSADYSVPSGLSRIVAEAPDSRPQYSLYADEAVIAQEFPITRALGKYLSAPVRWDSR